MLFEIVILVLQLVMFYLFPLLSGPTDAIGMVLVIILVTFFLALILGLRGKLGLRFIYPVLVAILFIPSVFIYYNESALVHSTWYLVVSGVGLGLGFLLGKIGK